MFLAQKPMMLRGDRTGKTDLSFFGISHMDDGLPWARRYLSSYMTRRLLWSLSCWLFTCCDLDRRGVPMSTFFTLYYIICAYIYVGNKCLIYYLMFIIIITQKMYWISFILNLKDDFPTGISHSQYHKWLQTLRIIKYTMQTCLGLLAMNDIIFT